MHRLDRFTLRQIRNRPRQLQDAMIGARRQIELTHRREHQTLTFILQFAELPYLPDTHIGVADDVGLRIGKALLLNIACRLHTIANRFAGLPHSITAQLFVVHSWDFDVNVNLSSSEPEIRF